ncbi:MAG: type II toxin-antitoxin system RelE/ParE family toxin [Deltaproteobacteria bacterium]|nr:type II toxin-antitoxin system RelE/ParE family toxin [Deltaproteobacteria bacterium]
MKIVWTRTAIRDLVGIRRYIGHDNPTAARDMASRILVAVNRLGKHPEMGRIGRLAGTRELVVSGTPYLVPYRIRAKAIQLLRVLHGHQEWPKQG